MKDMQAKPERSTKLFSIRNLQLELSISRPTANRLISGGYLKTVRLGRAIRIPESSVLDFIAKGGQKNIQESKITRGDL